MLMVFVPVRLSGVCVKQELLTGGGLGGPVECVQEISGGHCA